MLTRQKCNNRIGFRKFREKIWMASVRRKERRYFGGEGISVNSWQCFPVYGKSGKDTSQSTGIPRLFPRVYYRYTCPSLGLPDYRLVLEVPRITPVFPDHPTRSRPERFFNFFHCKENFFTIFKECSIHFPKSFDYYFFYWQTRIISMKLNKEIATILFLWVCRV